jgi:hypothetical protein
MRLEEWGEKQERLAHNANLSIKAILALRAYADLCDAVGKKPEAASYKKLATDFAAQWVKKADDGDHYRLAFDKPGTWSQKYNLVWDKILGYNLFPAEVARKEMAFYKKSQLAYGLPLDNRKEYTKLDWVLWTATLAETPADFGALLDPVFDWLNKTPDRVPLTDWYWTNSGKQTGFQARPVGTVLTLSIPSRRRTSGLAQKGQRVFVSMSLGLAYLQCGHIIIPVKRGKVSQSYL